MQVLLGKKIGMTRIFDDEGRQVVVTAIKCEPCVVLQRKSRDRDGYEAIQLGFEDAKENKMAKAAAGRGKKLNLPLKRHLFEVRINSSEEYKEGDVLSVSVFEGVSHVDVSGITKGRGFQGVVKRYRMSGGPMTHGGHSKRRIGSIGCRELPGRVHKGKRMPGHMGGVRRTLQNLKVVKVLGDDGVIMVGGGVPGHAGSMLEIKSSVKKIGKV
jgi:large subunit ribosomal protein L3